MRASRSRHPVGAAAREIVFTSGGTEANHLALPGAGVARRLVSAIEHDSVRARPRRCELIPVNAAGVVDLAALEALLAADSAAGAGLGHAGEQRDRRDAAGGRGRRVCAPPRRAASLRCGPGRWAGCRWMSARSASICSACRRTRSAGPPGVGALYVRSGLDLAPAAARRRAGARPARGHRESGRASPASAPRRRSRLASWSRYAAGRGAARRAGSRVFTRPGPRR